MVEWKEIPAYPNYRVSSCGRVESKLSGAWSPLKLRLINKGSGRKEYYGFNVRWGEMLPSGKAQKTKTLFVHVVVAELFIGPRPAGMLVLHRNDDRSSNGVDNLVYGTQKENVAMAVANGKWAHLEPIRGNGGRFAGSRTT